MLLEVLEEAAGQPLLGVEAGDADDDEGATTWVRYQSARAAQPIVTTQSSTVPSGWLAMAASAPDWSACS